MFALFSTEDHDIFTEKMLSSPLFIDIITTLFTYAVTWPLTVHKLATCGHRLPLDTTYIPYTKAMNVPHTESVRDGADLCRDFKQGIQQNIKNASWNHAGDKHLIILLLFPVPLLPRGTSEGSSSLLLASPAAKLPRSLKMATPPWLFPGGWAGLAAGTRVVLLFRAP